MNATKAKKWAFSKDRWMYSEYHEAEICLSEEPSTNDYQLDIECSNCGHDDLIDIKKGVPINQVLKQIKCRGCGCTGTMRKCL